MFTKKFLVDMTERALTTGAEVLLAALGTTTLFHVDWRFVASTTGGAVLASVLKSIIARNTGTSESASLVQ